MLIYCQHLHGIIYSQLTAGLMKQQVQPTVVGIKMHVVYEMKELLEVEQIRVVYHSDPFTF